MIFIQAMPGLIFFIEIIKIYSAGIPFHLLIKVILIRQLYTRLSWLVQINASIMNDLTFNRQINFRN